MNDDLFGAAMTELVKVLERIAAALEAAQPVAADEYTIALRTKELEEQGWKPFAQDALQPGGTIMRRPRQQPAPDADAGPDYKAAYMELHRVLKDVYEGVADIPSNGGIQDYRDALGWVSNRIDITLSNSGSA